MEDGPPGFPRGSTCPAVLRVALGCRQISHTGLSPPAVDLSRSFCYLLTSHIGPLQPPALSPGALPASQYPTPCRCDLGNRQAPQLNAGFGLLRFRSPLLAESLLISSPPGTEMFQFPGFASNTRRCRMIPYYRDRVSPFGYLRINACLAAPRSFSQLTTSFIASQRLGIHHLPFLA